MATSIGKLAVQISANSAELNAGLDEAAGRIQKFGGSLRSLQGEGQRVWDATRTPMEQYQMRSERLALLYQKGAINATTYTRAINAARERLDSLTNSTNGAEQAQERLGAGMGKFGQMLGVLAMIHTAATVAKALADSAKAEAELGTAIGEASATGIMKAQLASQEAAVGVLASVPIIGGAIKSILDVWGDRAGIEKLIKNIEDVERRLEETHKYRLKLAEESAIREAQLAGKSQAEIEALKFAGTARERQIQKDAAQAVRRDAAQAVTDWEKQYERSYRLNKEYLDYVRANAARLGPLVLRDAQNGFNELDTAHQKLLDDLAKADADYQAIAKLTGQAGVQDAKAIADQKAKDSAAATDAMIADLKELDAAYRESAAGQQDAAIYQTIDALQQQAATFGKNARELALYNLGINQATDDQKKLVNGLYDQIDAAKKQADMNKEAARILDEVRTPTEKLDAALSHLMQVWANSDTTEETYNREAKELQDQFGGKGGPQEKLSGAVEANTMQEYSILVGSGESWGDKTAENTSAIAKGIDQSNTHLAVIESKLKDSEGPELRNIT